MRVCRHRLETGLLEQMGRAQTGKTGKRGKMAQMERMARALREVLENQSLLMA
jgi:hypothetical protein